MAATITLSTVVLNLATDPSQYRFFSTMSELKVVPSIQGGVVAYASRSRLVTRGSVTSEIELVLPLCTRDQINWLRTYVGQIMWFRDDRGRKIPVAYLSVPVTENSGDTTGDVTLKLSEVTFSDVI